jgi:hypothetical protein
MDAAWVPARINGAVTLAPGASCVLQASDLAFALDQFQCASDFVQNI